jgi:membrane protein
VAPACCSKSSSSLAEPSPNVLPPIVSGSSADGTGMLTVNQSGSTHKGAAERLDDWQASHPTIGFPFAVVKKFIDDDAAGLGVRVAYWGFCSVFSLLLVFVSILGFAFQGDPSFQKQVLDSTLGLMPVIGPQISGHVGSLTGSGVALAIGLVGALWTGLGVTLAMGVALDRIWAVERVDRSGFVKSRLRGLLVLASVGVFTVAATAAVGLATDGSGSSPLGQVLSFATAAGIDLVVFLASFRLLTAASLTTRQVLPGAALAAACWVVLQAVGGIYVAKILKGSTQNYGGFAAVIGLLTWLLIAAEITLMAAEVNVDQQLLQRLLGERIVETLARQPGAMELGPRGLALAKDPAVAHQLLEHPVTRRHPRATHVIAAAQQIPQPLELQGRRMHEPQHAGAIQRHELLRVSAVGLDAIPGADRDQRRRDHVARHSDLRQQPPPRKPARPGLIADRQPCRAAQPVDEPADRALGRLDPTDLGLTAVGRQHRCDDRELVLIDRDPPAHFTGVQTRGNVRHGWSSPVVCGSGPAGPQYSALSTRERWGARGPASCVHTD